MKERRNEGKKEGMKKRRNEGKEEKDREHEEEELEATKTNHFLPFRPKISSLSTHLSRRPRGSQRENCLHGDVETRHVESLEHDFGGVFAILGRV